ncbi:hypothetical protein ACFQ5H_07985 [Robinsoniella peoriensis]
MKFQTCFSTFKMTVFGFNVILIIFKQSITFYVLLIYEKQNMFVIFSSGMGKWFNTYIGGKHKIARSVYSSGL